MQQRHLQSNPVTRTPSPNPNLLLIEHSKVYLKLENLQPSGSFKSRGIGHYMACRIAERQKLQQDRQSQSRSPSNNSIPTTTTTTTNPPSKYHFYASSGGNAGLAAVFAAHALGNHPCTVVVAQSTKPFMIAKLRASGAHAVIQRGASWFEADAFMREELMASDPDRAIYVPPFDHEDIWEGHASLVDEVYAQWEEEAGPPAAVICSVGGGGLFNGVVKGLERARGWEGVRVLAVETEGADSLNACVRAGRHVSLPGITSQASSLGAVRVSEKTWELSLRPNVRSVVLSDAEAAIGCWRLADDERILVEMACGVGVALCYDGRLERVLGRKVSQEDSVVVVLCGGSIVTLELLMRWRQEFGWVERSVPAHEDVSSDFTAPTKS